MEATTFQVTAEMVKPITDALNSGLTTLLPIGISIFATWVGVGLIPRVIGRFL